MNEKTLKIVGAVCLVIAINLMIGFAGKKQTTGAANGQNTIGEAVKPEAEDVDDSEIGLGEPEPAGQEKSDKGSDNPASDRQEKSDKGSGDSVTGGQKNSDSGSGDPSSVDQKDSDKYSAGYETDRDEVVYGPEGMELPPEKVENPTNTEPSGDQGGSQSIGTDAGEGNDQSEAQVPVTDDGSDNSQNGSQGSEENEEQSGNGDAEDQMDPDSQGIEMPVVPIRK